MYRVGIKVHFDAAHHLRGYEGKCRNLHGHRWVVEAVFRGKALNSVGMLEDFTLLKKYLKEVVESYDHTNLNENSPFDEINPTAENIARVIYKTIKDKMPQHILLEKVVVWESPECWASYCEEGS